MQLQTRLEDNPALRNAAVVLVAVAAGAAGGLLIAGGGNPVVPFALLAGLVALPFLVTRPMFDMVFVAATIMLLPFAVVPVRLAVLTPTLLELGLIFLYTAWALRVMLNPGEKLVRTPLDGWLLLFFAATLFAFVLGIWRDPSTDVVHNYFKLALAVGVFFAAVNLLRGGRQIGTLLRVLMPAGALCALIGVALWRLPDETAGALLGRLSALGYPSSGIIRYVEDNPALGERAIGTQVDPNSFGGLLVVVAALTGVQLLSRRPLLPRYLLAAMFLTDVAALVLTNSRTALVGLVAAGALVATVRYRRLWAWGIALAVLLALAGAGGGYFTRLAAGLRFEDQANLMRLAEYRNALDIIARYPAFGVGFGTAGELNLTTGVSSVYLTVAERTGLLGLGLYLAVLLVFFTTALKAVRVSGRQARAPGASEGEAGDRATIDSALLGGTAALLGAAVVGLTDHYYFNIEFPHMAALFWLVAGLTLAAARCLQREQAAGGASPPPE